MKVETIYRATIIYDSANGGSRLPAVTDGLFRAVQTGVTGAIGINSFAGDGSGSPTLTIESMDKKEVERALRRGLDYLEPLEDINVW